MLIYNAKEMSLIKKADFHLKESAFLVILNELTHVFVCIIYSKLGKTQHIIDLFVFASFSNTPHAIFQVAAFYQIWQASVFHETLPQLPDLCNPIDISPLCSPTFLVFQKIYSTNIIYLILLK